jgi:hypothetical protein
MYFFSHLILLVSAIGTQAAAILPADNSASMQFAKREPSPIAHQDANLGGKFMKRMVNHLNVRDGADFEGLMGDAVDVIKRSINQDTLDEMKSVGLQAREYLESTDAETISNNLMTATEQFLNLGDGPVMKILGFVFGLLREAQIVDDIVKIVEKVTRVIVNKLFSIGSGSSGSLGGSKAPAAEESAPDTDSKAPAADTKAPASDSKAPAADAGSEAEPAADAAGGEDA